MYCLGCSYELRGLEAGQCPECGRVFSPDDAATFATDKSAALARWFGRGLEAGLLVCGGMPLLANLFALASLVIARLILGRWPQLGEDDPSGVPGMQLAGTTAILLVVAALSAVPAAAAFMVGLAYRREWRRLLRSGMIAILLWTLGFQLFRADPTRVWSWLSD